MPIKILTLRFIILLSLSPLLALAQDAIAIETDTLMLQGKTNYSSSFFRERLLHNSFGSFVDNYNDFLIFQTTSHGDFHTPDQTVISIQGNSYRWNKYYSDGFRMDNRIQPGSYLYEQDLYSNALSIDTYNSEIHFLKDKTVPDAALLRYNHGNIGGITSGTDWFFHLFHKTALETAFKPINYRRNMNGQGVFIFDKNIQHHGQQLHQHAYIDIGQRELVALDFAANNTPFYENYIKAVFQGDLPTRNNGFFNTLNYALATSYRDHFNHEFYYGEHETAKNKHVGFSVYGNSSKATSTLTTGLTYALQSTEHNDLNFSRNQMDIDGESFFPYSPDANTSEFTHALTYQRTLDEHLSLNVETYNSLIYNHPTTERYSNGIYFESLVNPIDNSWMEESSPFYTSLYVYDWESKAFTTGLLENSFDLSYSKHVSEKISIKSHLGLTLDGILLNDKSIVRANWEADVFMNWTPNPYLSIGLNAGRKRIAFHYDMARYLSNDYMHRDIYYWQDDNADKVYQSNEKSDYLRSSGGIYRELDKNIKQPAYLFVDLPIVITVGKKHMFSIVTTYKKFYNQWQSVFASSADNYGSFEQDRGQNIFFFNDGQDIRYTINSERPAGLELDQTAEFMTNTPFSLTNIAKYVYNGEKAFFSISWVSQFMMNVSDLGNSPQENNVEIYSDYNANPNTQIKNAGRPQQDRGYVARLLYAYKFNEHFKASFLFKFVDGQPFAKYDTRLKTDNKGNTQIATWRYQNNSTSPFYDGWGDREDMGFNTELRVAYTAFLPNSKIEFNISGYNLIDFAYELISTGFDLPMDYRRSSIEICAPRGMMFTTKISF